MSRQLALAIGYSAKAGRERERERACARSLRVPRTHKVIKKDMPTHALVSAAQNVALAYAWCKVCFDAWDATLDAAGEQLLRYSRWPQALRLLLHALYPAYFVYASAKRLSGPEGPRDPAELPRWMMLLSVACTAVGVLGLRHGRTARSKDAATG